ncbi:MAG: DUF2169 domain-containing protein [Alcaligenaceae bacterium]|nr:DUF2169 domain-containing protein [Alcaligenaceae bacterium]
MKILKPNRSTLIYRPYKYKRQNYLSITVALLVDYKEAWVLKTEQDLWTLFKEESMTNFKAETLDLGVTKRHPELILSAYAFSEYADENNQAIVAVKVNNIHKKLLVSGDRYWDGAQISKAKAFDKIPLSREFAYGGECFTGNSIGIGHHKSSERGFNNLGQQRLPNVEDPEHRITVKKKEYEAVTFSPIAIDNIERNVLMGTYDEEWRKFDAPGFANDVDWRYFNQAPRGQVFNSLSIGDQIVFTHMHPEKKELKTEVPPIVVKTILKKLDSDEFLETKLNLTTYWAYPHLEKSILVFQVDVPISGEDPVDDFELLAVAVEHCERSQDLENYLKHIKMLDKSEGMQAFDDRYLMDTAFICFQSFEIYSPKDMLKKQLTRLVEGAEELERQLKSELTYPNTEEFKEAIAEVQTKKLKLKAKLDALKDTMTLEEIQALEDIEGAEDTENTWLKEARAKMRAEVYETPRGTEGGNKVKRIKVIFPEQDEMSLSLVDGFKNLLLIDKQSPEQDQLGLDSQSAETMLSRFNEADELILDQKKMVFPSFTQEFTFNESVSFALNSLTQLNNNIELSNQYDVFYLNNEHLENKKLNGVRAASLYVDKAVFKQIDFSKSALIRCRFNQIVFQDCDFTQTALNFTHFVNCKFVHCVFKKTNLTKTVFNKCHFEGCDFTELNHTKLGVYDTIFNSCHVHELSFTRLRFTDLQFKNCRLTRVIFLDCLGNKLDFRTCKTESLSIAGKGRVDELGVYESSIFEMFHLGSEVKLGTLSIDNSDVPQSSLREIKCPLNIRCSNLSGSDFSRSLIASSKFENSDFTNCIFTKTQLTDGIFKKNDFKYAKARAAIFNGSFFEKTSFYFADLALVETDENNVFEQCFFEGANVYPQNESSKDYAPY